MPTFTLRIALESAYALTPEQESDENWRIWTAEAVAALTQLTAVLERNDAPATFFVVGKLVERAGPELARLLRDKPGFDVGSHTYSHTDIIDDSPAALERFSRELVLTSDLILDHFGRRPTGFCSPGGHYRGLQGHPGQLAILWEQGYRYIGSDNSGPPEQWQPSPMTQPYWYTDDGFGDLFEVPGTGWHCNYLFNSGGQNDDWSPAPGFPDGTILERLPVTVEEGFEARRREFRYAIDNDLVYSPSMHPWSVYRFDPELEHIERLIKMARHEGVPVVSCKQLYEQHLAAGAPVRAYEQRLEAGAPVRAGEAG